MRSISSAALLTLSLALGACGPVNRGLESVNQPVVSRTDYVFDVPAAGLATPGSAEAERIAGWLDSLRVGYGDHVSIDESAAYPGASRSTIASVVARYGLLLSDTAPVTSGAIAPGTVRVIVSRSTASMERCPDWRSVAQPEYASSTMSNYGCATNGNLALMIADPQDLITGKTGDGPDPAMTTKAIKAYRDAALTGGAMKTESTGAK